MSATLCILVSLHEVIYVKQDVRSLSMVKTSSNTVFVLLLQREFIYFNKGFLYLGKYPEILLKLQMLRQTISSLIDVKFQIASLQVDKNTCFVTCKKTNGHMAFLHEGKGTKCIIFLRFFFLFCSVIGGDQGLGAKLVIFTGFDDKKDNL